jgi:hypothetical protein
MIWKHTFIEFDTFLDSDFSTLIEHRHNLQLPKPFVRNRQVNSHKYIPHGYLWLTDFNTYLLNCIDGSSIYSTLQQHIMISLTSGELYAVSRMMLFGLITWFPD